MLRAKCKPPPPKPSELEGDIVTDFSTAVSFVLRQPTNAKLSNHTMNKKAAGAELANHTVRQTICVHDKDNGTKHITLVKNAPATAKQR